MRWTKAYRKSHGNWSTLRVTVIKIVFRVGKEMTVDATLEFEKKRDEALRYNRNLVVATVQAMKRISDIREHREKVFWENRFGISFHQTVFHDIPN